MRRIELQLKTEASRLQGWALLPIDYYVLPLVVLCHGIPSGIEMAGEPGYEDLAKELAQNGIASLFFNFRGAGFSEGDFSMGGWVDDLQAALDLVFQGEGAFSWVHPEKVALWGYSGGGAAAILCAARDHRPAATVSLAAPDGLDRIFPRADIGEFIRHCRMVGLIKTEGYPASEDEFFDELMAHRPIDCVSHVAPTPLLIVHGTSDEMVPVECARSLHEAAGNPKSLVIIERGEHKLRLNRQATGAALAWLKRTLDL